MDILDRFRSLFIDDYKMGAESQTDKSIIYFDPNQFDQKKVIEIMGRTNDLIVKIQKEYPGIDISDPQKIDSLPDKFKKPLLEEVDKLAQMAGDHLDQSVQGISQLGTRLKLASILVSGLSDGPYAVRDALGTNMCLINQPLGDKLDPENILKDGLFGFAKQHGFNPDHFKPLPGNKAVWDRLVGAHEGEHCNQDDLNLEGLKGDDLTKKTIEGETRSDKAAIKDLIANGNEDVAQAWKDIRIISAVNGDVTHATTLFLDDEKFEGISDDQLHEIKNIKKRMNDAVAEAMGETAFKAEDLRKADPQRYADLLQQQIDAGKFPAKIPITDIEQGEKISHALGITTEELKNAGASDIPRIMEAYKKLKDAGEFTTTGKSPETSTRLAQQYIDASRRLMVPDTTPKEAPSASKKIKPLSLSDENIDLTDDGSEISDDDLELEAMSQREQIMDRAVGKQLELDDDGVTELKESDPEAYLKAAKEALKSGKVEQTTEHSLTPAQLARRQERILGIEPGQLQTVPYFIQVLSEEALETDPRGKIKYNNITEVANPHTTKAAVLAIQEFEQELRNPTPKTDAETDVDTPEKSTDEAPAADAKKEASAASLFKQNAADVSAAPQSAPEPDVRVAAAMARQRQPSVEAMAV